MPHQNYLVAIEILHTDTNAPDVYADITLDGINFGRCNPKGIRFKCSWHDCSLPTYYGTNVPKRLINSTNGVILFKAAYSYSYGYAYGHEECSVNGVSGAAFARVTLTPEKRTNGKFKTARRNLNVSVLG